MDAQRRIPSALRVAQVASGQDGVASRQQLIDAHLHPRAILRWVAAGRLFEIFPGVYAVGHEAISERGRLRAALLWAGDEAGLAHDTAAYILALAAGAGSVIHVSSPRRLQPAAGIRVHRPRTLELITHEGLRVTSVAQTLADMARSRSARDLRRMLAEAEYQGILDRDAIAARCGRGRRGSGRLALALATHVPALARSRSELERRFVELCIDYELPLPEVNLKVGGLTVDCYWPEAKLVVELDGARGHDGERRQTRDANRDLHLRSLGILTLRFRWLQITEKPASVATDLLTQYRLRVAPRQTVER